MPEGTRFGRDPDGDYFAILPDADPDGGLPKGIPVKFVLSGGRLGDGFESSGFPGPMVFDSLDELLRYAKL